MFFQRNDTAQNFTPEPDGAEKTGPSLFWAMIKEELASLLIVNMLFLITCIPVVTIPLALFSLHSVIWRIIQFEGVSCARHYFTAFRQGWKRAYGAFFLTAGPLGISGYGAAFYLRRAVEYPVFLIPFAFCAAVFLVVTLASTYLYGLLCSGKSLREASKSALLLGIAKPLRAVLAALCFYGVTLLSAAFFPLSGAYLALIGFSIPCLLGNFYVRTVLNLYCSDV